jgi:hypothetical protein
MATLRAATAEIWTDCGGPESSRRTNGNADASRKQPAATAQGTTGLRLSDHHWGKWRSATGWERAKSLYTPPQRVPVIARGGEAQLRKAEDHTP